MALPFIPGYVAQTNQSMQPKIQTLIYKNGYAIPVSQPITPSNGEQVNASFDPALMYPVLKKDYTYTVGKTPELLKPRKEIKIEHKALGFEAYFIENVPNNPTEKERVRQVTISYFVDEEAFMIQEPKQPNSGLPQGILLKKQKVPKNKEQTSFYTLQDLNMGVTLNVFGRKYKIVNCDFFTQSYLKEAGIDVKPQEPIPVLNETRVHSPQKTVDPQKEKTRRFLSSDGKVLRFYSVWDNREKLFGEARRYIIHYFTVDDSIEIREGSSISGHSPFSVFLKKQPLPKGSDKNDIIKEQDLKTGITLSVFGRQFYIYDCDKFTRDYYKESYGVELSTFEIEALKEPEIPVRTSGPGLLGETRDKKKFQKLLNNDGKVLRFAGKLVSSKVEDKDRVFIVSYYLADDTMGIFEPPQRNSGILGGKFLERKTVQKPGTSENYKAVDFFVGAEVEVFRHKFSLHDADEYAFNYMEANPSEFPMSDIDVVQQKLKQRILDLNVDLKETFSEMDKDGNGYISLEEFRDVIHNLGFAVTDQEIITIVRRYDLDGDGKISYQELQAAVNS